MPKYSDFKGVIFDIDDTLLDNKYRDPDKRLHSRSRLAAVHEVGRRHGLKELQAITKQQNHDAWTNTTSHSIEGAAWQILLTAGLVKGETINYDHPLLKEIVTLKEELHEAILRQEGEELPDASRFVRVLAEHGFRDKLAIASTAKRSEIDIFLEKYDLTSLFPKARIFAKDSVANFKPHPEVYELAFSSLDLPDSARPQVLAFEDNPHGIISAKSAGLYVCAITTQKDRSQLAELEIAPDIIADSFREFAGIFGLPLA